MVTVPRISESRVQQSGLPGQSFRVDTEPGAFSAGPNAGPISDAMVAILEAEKKRADNIKVREAKNSLVSAGNNFMAEATQKRGKNAMTLPDEYDEFYQKQIDEIEKGLSSNTQKDQFSIAAREEYMSRVNSIGKHVAREKFSWDNAELEASISNEQQRAAQNYDDLEQVAMSLKNIRRDVDTFSNDNGLGDKAKEALMFDSISATHIGVINNLMVNDPEKAKIYYDENKADINQSDLPRSKLLSKINGLQKEMRREATEELYDKQIFGTITQDDILERQDIIGNKDTNAWLNRIRKDQERDIKEIQKNKKLKKASRKYLELVNAVASDDFQEFDLKAVLVDAMDDGVVDNEEAMRLNQIKSEMKDIKNATKNNWFKNAVLSAAEFINPDRTGLLGAFTEAQRSKEGGSESVEAKHRRILERLTNAYLNSDDPEALNHEAIRIMDDEHIRNWPERANWVPGKVYNVKGVNIKFNHFNGVGFQNIDGEVID